MRSRATAFRRGATLVELIAAMVLLGIAVPPLVATLGASMERQREHADRQDAIRLTEAVLETIVADAFAGSETIDITAAEYADGIAARLGGVDAHYESLGLAWAVDVAGPMGSDGVVTGTDADRYYRATVTTRFRAGRAAEESTLSASTLVSVFPTEPSGPVMARHPGGWATAHTMMGVDGAPRDANRWRTTDDDFSVYCPWANRTITYSQDVGPTATDWAVGITVKNYDDDGLPSWYTNFQVDVRVNGTTRRVNIPASDMEWSTVWIDLGEQSGTVDVELRWRNDAYRRGQYDANIQIGAVQFAQDPAGGGGS